MHIIPLETVVPEGLETPLVLVLAEETMVKVEKVLVE
jgi:hypothetical protein